MDALPVVALQFRSELNDVDVISSVPVRVIRIGDPTCPVHVWEMSQTADPKRLIDMLGEAVKEMHGDPAHLIEMLADALQLMYHKFWGIKYIERTDGADRGD